MVGKIFIMSVGNVQELSVKVSNRVNNYLRNYDDLKFTKSLPLIIIIIMQPTNAAPLPVKC